MFLNPPPCVDELTERIKKAVFNDALYLQKLLLNRKSRFTGKRHFRLQNLPPEVSHGKTSPEA